MATVVGYAYARIDQEGKKWYDDDSKPNTCFGLPGSSGRRASYSAVHMDVHVAVLDDGNVHIGFNGGISDWVISDSGYTSAMAVGPSYWTWQNSGGYATAPSGVWTVASADINVPVESWDSTVGANYGTYWWGLSASAVSEGQAFNSPSGYFNIGPMSQYGADDNGKNGSLWISGTGTYYNSNPTYPVPIRITIPRYLGYMPGARRISSSWQACNRSGGSCNRRASGVWATRWNDERSAAVSDNEGLRRVSGAWVRSGKF